MIQAYPDKLSVSPGQQIGLHVSCDGPSFRVAVYRQGPSLDWQQDFIFTSQHQGFEPQPFWDRPWGWDSYPLAIPAEWSSGVYVCMLFERAAGGSETTPDYGVATSYGRWGKALFVVRNPNPGATTNLLYKMPFATWHAYNHTGGGSLYTTGPTVTMHRPGGGTGGEVTPFEPDLGDGDVDQYDSASSRQTFEHWDAKFIRWLEGSGYRCDYMADADLDPERSMDVLRAYGILVTVGHDEYWSPGTRANVEAFVSGGGNLAIFGGNTCWWRIHYDNLMTSFTCAKIEQGDPNEASSDHWYIASRYEAGVRPENGLTGVSYRNGAGSWRGPRQAVGYLVQHAERWPFEGTGLAEHDTFGAADLLVGYECDGAETTGFDCGSQAGVAVPTTNDGTPASFEVLGIGCIGPEWIDRHGTATATMGWYSAVGTVFNGATTDWSRVLEARDGQVSAITRTVLNRLGGNPKGLADLTSVQGAMAVDGFWSPDDGNRHAIVATTAGEIHEIYFNPQRGIFQDLLTNVAGAIDVCAFYSEDDRYRHAIVAAAEGTIYEVYFRPDVGINVERIGTVLNGVAVAGFYSPDDGNRHAIVATSTGDIYELYFNPQRGIFQDLLTNVAGALDVAAFYSADDSYRHAIVAAADGAIYEVYFRPDVGISVVQLATVEGIARVSAFYAADDAFFNRRVVGITRQGILHEIRFSPTSGIIRSVALAGRGVTDAGGFFSGDDKYRHVAVLSAGGSVQELFYRP